VVRRALSAPQRAKIFARILKKAELALTRRQGNCFNARNVSGRGPPTINFPKRLVAQASGIASFDFRIIIIRLEAPRRRSFRFLEFALP